MPWWVWVLGVLLVFLGLALIGYLMGPQGGAALTKRDQRILERRAMESPVAGRVTGLSDAWYSVRLDPAAATPDRQTIERIAALEVELATLGASDLILVSALDRQTQIAVELFDLGARVDGELANEAIRNAPGFTLGTVQSQDEYDEWQREQVAARDDY